MPPKIGINGYGTIGKRVADAVAAQDDMRLAGVAKTKPDFEAKLAVRKGYAVYAANKDALAKFEKAGIKAAGILDDLVREVDLVVDCTPEDSGYKPLYEKAGVKAIWQGGEEHSLTNLSFNAAANYADCLGAPFVRVPSCNTTGLIRTLYPLDAHVGVEKVLAVMVRRATDPGDSKKGPINAIEPELEMPSHHGPDLSRSRSDLYEIAVWRDGVHVVDGKRLYYFQAVHQESDVVPENIDAIRAMLELEKDGRKSMEKTDRSLGIGIAK